MASGDEFDAEFEGEDTSEVGAIASVVSLEGDNEVIDEKEFIILLKNVSLQKPSQAKAWVWEYFGKYPPTISRKVEIVCCTICRELSNPDPEKLPKISWEINYSLSKSTSKLTNHMHAHHPQIYASEMQQKQIEVEINQKKPLIEQFLTRSTMTCQREAYLEWIVSDEIPLRIITSEAFHKYIKSINPNYQFEDRKSLVQRLTLKANEVRLDLKTILQGVNFSFTCDCWTSIANETYIGVTCHFIDEDWISRSYVLACDHFSNILPYPRIGCFNHLVELLLKIPFETGMISNTLSE